ncbi:MAG TPA: RDD family protein [Streptosporangiaceae bacterium]|nr:RDD family protein [Streptosporangiaceae bacterium]
MTDVVTGEAVALELPVAAFPSRIAARLLDMILQGVGLLILQVALTITLRPTNFDYAAAEFLTAYVLVIVAYPTVFETLSRGKTLGKLALGIRVVGDDGSPVRFRQALVRALVGAFEIWTFVLAPVALITSIISARGKRVGDVFAGTYVIQERVPPRQALPPVFAIVPPPLAGWAQVVQVATLSDETAEAASSYLRRFGELNPQARDALGVQLANAVAGQVSPLPPVGTPPAAYLSAVLAVRRAREFVRLAPPPGPLPAQPAATEPAPAQPARAQPAPAQPAATQPAPAQPAARQPALTDPAPTPDAPAEAPPAEPTHQGLAPPA